MVKSALSCGILAVYSLILLITCNADSRLLFSIVNDVGGGSNLNVHLRKADGPGSILIYSTNLVYPIGSDCTTRMGCSGRMFFTQFKSSTERNFTVHASLEGNLAVVELWGPRSRIHSDPTIENHTVHYLSTETAISYEHCSPGQLFSRSAERYLECRGEITLSILPIRFGVDRIPFLGHAAAIVFLNSAGSSSNLLRVYEDKFVYVSANRVIVVDAYYGVSVTQTVLPEHICPSSIHLVESSVPYSFYIRCSNNLTVLYDLSEETWIYATDQKDAFDIRTCPFTTLEVQGFYNDGWDIRTTSLSSSLDAIRDGTFQETTNSIHVDDMMDIPAYKYVCTGIGSANRLDVLDPKGFFFSYHLGLGENQSEIVLILDDACDEWTANGTYDNSIANEPTNSDTILGRKVRMFVEQSRPLDSIVVYSCRFGGALVVLRDSVRDRTDTFYMEDFSPNDVSMSLFAWL